MHYTYQRRTHTCTLYTICTQKQASCATHELTNRPPRTQELIKLLFPHTDTHTHTCAHTPGWNLMECDLVWSLGVGSLICMQAVFANVPRPMIIIINPDWGIGTPNLTGLYGSSHSCRTGVTLYYGSVTLSYTLHITNCWKLKINDLREHYFGKLDKSSLTHIDHIVRLGEVGERVDSEQNETPATHKAKDLMRALALLDQTKSLERLVFCLTSHNKWNNLLFDESLSGPNALN